MVLETTEGKSAGRRARLACREPAMQQTVAYALITDDDVGRLKKGHDPLHEIRAGKDDIGSLRVQSRFLFLVRLGHGSINRYLAAHFVE